MLVLSVRPRQFVQIGDDIKVYNNNEINIQLAIEAPKEIAILRPDANVKAPKPSEK